MAKPTGFMEYTRTQAPDREPKQRIADWEEFHMGLTPEQQREQGARCMDCGIPFCHSGLMMSGGASGCPINNLIPEWNELIYRGLWEQAFTRLMKTNNFPEFTGRVCPAPCEGACTLSIIEPAVTIKANECSIIDYAYEQGWMKPNPPAERTGKTVAVIGSGPAGLACADQLNKAGHSVTVFERSDRIGGLLMYGIPNMKLDKQKVVQRRVDLMTQEGVVFKTNANVGENVDAKALMKDFDAVIICTGSTKPRDLVADGREANGVHFAVDFLTQNTKSLLDSKLSDGNYISAKDKDVIVIGGGDTGTDCVATSIRHGCKSVVQFEIMPQPPKERRESNPWPEWPNILRVDYGQEEAAELYGRVPREYCIMTKSIERDESGNVTKLNTVDIEWKKDANGRFTPVELEGTQRTWDAQLVLLAMGFVGPEEGVLDAFGVSRDARGNCNAQYGEYTTNVDGVFAAGDARRGQSLVVWAINEGRGAARECDRFLRGDGATLLP